jgi:hypothetical protein
VEKNDIMQAVMMLFISLLLGTIITALFDFGSRLDEITVDQARLILCHNHSIIPCK